VLQKEKIYNHPLKREIRGFEFLKKKSFHRK